MGLNATDTGWIIGAATPAVRLTRNESLQTELPGLVEAVALIGSDQIQSRASVGGNICNASPAADTGPSMVVNRAVAVVASSAGERQVPVSELVIGPGQVSLDHGELVVEFKVDRPTGKTADSYLRFTPRTEMDIAVVGAAARVSITESGECIDAAVVLGAVGPTTLRVDGIAETLEGRPIDHEVLEAAAAMSRDQARPIDDKRGTSEFRRHIAGVLTKRALMKAAERADAR
jgi:carbon-monoxide dehydrogenase medium subunit